ncbi:MAG: 30S ribosomal protein S12 methylthiotransferase RimO [Planctomycetota bacterium]|nr:MAG: 30S ribosomal protein S12 methylthiotransferase RimO [Planctomycetota bacterium]
MTTAVAAHRSAALISLGCSKNLSDSEDLVTALRSAGVGLTTDLAEADVVLINTCGFIEGAKRESIDHILAAAEERKPDSLLVVAGCLTERYLDELRADMPEVDCWLPFKDYERLSALVRERFPDLPDHRLTHDQRSQLTPPHFAFLKIAEGCDNTCNFCAIPLFRGKHVSRPEEELVEQARTLAQRGVQEINLISQHLDYYGKDRYGDYRLPQLLRSLSAAAPDSWLRLHYCYPNDFSDELIRTMAELPNVLAYVDMPIQHASDRMLALMGRRTTRAHIEERLGRIRDAMPEVVLRSTFIVGFPGERDEDVDELIAFLEAQRFDHAGCFTYSDEDGTTAAKMPKKVPDELISQRHDRFMRAQAAILAKHLPKRWLGRELEVLVDEQLDFDRFHCRHYGQASEVDNVTIIRNDGLEVGRRIAVRITGIDGYDLVAEVR